MRYKYKRDNWLNALAITSWALAYILAGRITWNLLSPDQFGEFVLFVAGWILSGYTLQTVLFISITVIAALTTGSKGQ